MNYREKKVEGFNHLYRTPRGSIVNNDRAGYEAYKARRLAIAQKDETIASLQGDLKEVREELEKMKAMMERFIPTS